MAGDGMGRAPSPGPVPSRRQGSWYVSEHEVNLKQQQECIRELERRKALHQEEQQLWAEFRELKDGHELWLRRSNGVGRRRNDWEIFGEAIRRQKLRKLAKKGGTMKGSQFFSEAWRGADPVPRGRSGDCRSHPLQAEARSGADPNRAGHSRFRTQPFLEEARPRGDSRGRRAERRSKTDQELHSSSKKHQNTHQQYHEQQKQEAHKIFQEEATRGVSNQAIKPSTQAEEGRQESSQATILMTQTEEGRKEHAARTCFIDNIAPHREVKWLRNIFKGCGNIVGAFLPDYERAWRQNRFGFLSFSSKVEAEEAVKRWHDKWVDGRKLVVKMHDFRKPKAAVTHGVKKSSINAATSEVKEAQNNGFKPIPENIMNLFRRKTVKPNRLSKETGGEQTKEANKGEENGEDEIIVLQSNDESRIHRKEIAAHDEWPNETEARIIDLEANEELVAGLRCSVFLKIREGGFAEQCAAILRSMGIEATDICRAGGCSIMINFKSEEAREEALKSEELRKVVDWLKPWKEGFTLNYRTAWLCVYGLPYEVWKEDNLAKVVNCFGRFVKFNKAARRGKEAENVKMMIETDCKDRINSLITVRIDNKRYAVQVREMCCGASEGDHFDLNEDLLSTEVTAQEMVNSSWSGQQNIEVCQKHGDEEDCMGLQGSGRRGGSATKEADIEITMKDQDRTKETVDKDTDQRLPDWEHDTEGRKEKNNTTAFCTPCPKTGAEPRQESKKKKAMRFVTRMNEEDDIVEVGESGEEDTCSMEELWEKKKREGSARLTKRKQAKNKNKGKRRERRKKDYGDSKVIGTREEGALGAEEEGTSNNQEQGGSLDDLELEERDPKEGLSSREEPNFKEMGRSLEEVQARRKGKNLKLFSERTRKEERGEESRRGKKARRKDKTRQKSNNGLSKKRKQEKKEGMNAQYKQTPDVDKTFSDEVYEELGFMGGTIFEDKSVTIERIKDLLKESLLKERVCLEAEEHENNKL